MLHRQAVPVRDLTRDLPMYDRLFSLWVNAAQSSIVKAGAFLSSGSKQKKRSSSMEAIGSRLDALGLRSEKLWWGTMTLAPRKAEFLLNEIERSPPSQVLEVGAGTSTAILAAAAVRYGFDMLSLENHQSTISYVNYLTDEVDLTEHLSIQLCGFTRRRSGEGRYRWYNADLSGLKGPIDFAVIDGPMGTLVGRNGALPEIVPHLHPEHRIFLDDCKRSHEIGCVEEWKRRYPGLEVSIPDSAGVFSIKVPSKYLQRT